MTCDLCGFQMGKEANMDPKMKMLKELAKDQVRAVEDYFNKMLEVEKLLEDCRLNVTTAKSQNGFALSRVGIVDNREMEPTTLIQMDAQSVDTSNRFHLVDTICQKDDSEAGKSQNKLKQRKGQKSRDESADKTDKDDKDPETKHVPPNFRPFGLLEPRAAKTARKVSKLALEQICELASIQQTVFDLEKKIKLLDDEIVESLGDDYSKFVQISSESIDQKALENELKNNTWLKAAATPASS